MAKSPKSLTFYVAPLTWVCAGLSAVACLIVSLLKLDNVYLAYCVFGFGIAAGFFQWRGYREVVAKAGQSPRTSLPTQVYGMIIFTAICSVPGLLLGRALSGANIWTG